MSHVDLDTVVALDERIEKLEHQRAELRQRIADLEVQLVDANTALYAAGKTVGEQFTRITDLEGAVALNYRLLAKIERRERQLAEAREQIAAKDAALVEARGLFEAIMFHIDEHSFSLAKGLAAQGIHGLNAALAQTATAQGVCIDCEGIGRYPAGHTCTSCGGSGRVGLKDAIQPAPAQEDKQ